MSQRPHDLYLKSFKPFHSRYDPCPPIGVRFYSTPPNLFLGFQPPNLEQFPAEVALKKGTLWPALYDFYDNPYEQKREVNENGTSTIT